MDRRGAAAVRPVVGRQWSTNSNNDSSSSSPSTMSPAGSPIHPLSRGATAASSRHLGGAGAFSTIKRNQNVAAKAAARRLAQAMATQSAADNDEDGGAGGDDDVGGEDEDLGFRFRPPASFASSPNSSEDGSSMSSTGANGRVLANLPAGPGRINRTPSPALGRTIVDHAQSARSTSAGRPSATNRAVPVALSSKSSVRTPSAIPPVELPIPARRTKEKRPVHNSRLTPEIGHINLKDQGSSQDDASALLDELDMIQGENEGLCEQLRLLEVKREEAEARARQLEQQVATLGEGVSLEAKLLSRKEAALRQREAALIAAKQKKEDGKDGEMTTLRSELENLKIEASSTMDYLRQAESEAKALRIMTQRMVLTQEEMEEVVLKRCWLARYWGLAVQLGICSDIAVLKHEHWSAFAPLPFEVVFSAGQKAKEEFSRKGENGSDKESALARDTSNLTGDGNIESMLSVEMGLRELASLKIEDAVAISMAQLRRPNFVRDYRSPAELKFSEAYELNQEESQDVNFKLAWLTYFWKRARDHGVEEDIAEERVQYWISRIGQSLTSHDAVDVGRGLIELRKLGIEQLLWEASRKEIEDLPVTANGNHKQQSFSESEGSS